MTTTNPDWARAVKILEGAGQACLACHVRPDADALGSMLALGLALQDRLTVLASFDDEALDVPAGLGFLPGRELLVPAGRLPGRPEVMVSLDTSSPDRLGALAGRAAAAGQLIVLDHHASNTGFGTLNIVDPQAAATAVLAHELIERLGIRLTRDIALCLYTGLVADTGSFKYSSVTPAVHRLAAELLSYGIDPAQVSRELYDRAPFGYLGLLSAALGRAVLEPDSARGLGLAWTTVTLADRDRAGLPLDAAESVIDELRRTDEAEVAAVLKQADDGTWQVSVRSKSIVDVGRACAALGGGGHARAAGFWYVGGEGPAGAAARESAGAGLAAEGAIAALRRELGRP